MASILNPAPDWKPDRSEYLILWHGCTALDKSRIEANGIAVSQCAPDTDFGRGFYTTTLKDQAEQWAWSRFFEWQDANPKRRKNWPALLRFRMRRFTPPKQLVDDHEGGMDKLRSLAFVVGDRDSVDYWSLVQHCRRSTPQAIRDHGSSPGGWYDVVSGPVAAFWTQRVAMNGSDQVSFHTDAGIRILDALVKEGLKVGPKGHRRFYTWYRVR